MESEKTKNEFNSEEDQKNSVKKDRQEESYSDEENEEGRKKLGGKTILEMLADTLPDKIRKSIPKIKEESELIWCIPNNEMLRIFHNDNFENVWIKSPNEEKFLLCLMVYTNEKSLGIGESLNRDYYHLMLIGFIKAEGKYENGLQFGVYEFEISDLSHLGFSHHPNMDFEGKMIYMERNDFEEIFVIPIYFEDTYDHQLKNTIGLYEVTFN